MGTFAYSAKATNGEMIQGTMEADGEQAVATRLQAMGYFPLKITGDSKTEESGTSSVLKKLTAKRIGTSDITTLNRQLSDLISSGIPLVKALTIIDSQTPNEALRVIIHQVSQDVQGGDTLAQAMSKHPRIFSKLYVAMVRAGETGGMLDGVLQRLADFAESEQELKGRVQAMLIYPVVMVVVGIAAVIVLMTVVMPKIIGLYQEMQQSLPGITQVLITITNFMTNFWWAVVGGIAIAGFALYRFLKTEEGKLLFDRWILQLPVMGTVVQKREISRFARTFGALLRNGVSILPALEIVIEVMTNKIVRKEVEQIPPNISQGAGVANTLRNSLVFPPVVVNMIAIGEETGKLADTLTRVATSYEIEVDRSVRTLVSLIQPLIILVLGLVVGFIVIAMVLPIFSLDPSAGG